MQDQGMVSGRAQSSNAKFERTFWCRPKAWTNTINVLEATAEMLVIGGAGVEMFRVRPRSEAGEVGMPVGRPHMDARSRALRFRPPSTGPIRRSSWRGGISCKAI
jgi:hypothetical protein